MTGKELIKLLRQRGWTHDHVHGSHHILIRGTEMLSVPVHGNTDLKKGTLNALMKQGGIK